MTTEESKLITAFEKYKGHSSDLFDNEEWEEFDIFRAGAELYKGITVKDFVGVLADLVVNKLE